MGDYEPIDPAVDAAMSMEGDVDALRDYYDSWAGSYDDDLGRERYELTDQVARLLAEVVAMDRGEPIDGLTVDPGSPDASVLDVGCGTGLIGARLAADGYTTIDGIDLSEAMVEVAAARGCYRELRAGIDITAPLPSDLVGAHDVVCVGGVFTVGHVPPSALAAVAAMTRLGGLLIVTTRKAYHDETDYRAEVDRLTADGVLELLHANMDAPYTLDSPGHYWAYLVTGRADSVTVFS